MPADAAPEMPSTPTPSSPSDPPPPRARPNGHADAVARLAPSVVGVVASRRGFAAGALWKPGLVVTTAAAVWRAPQLAVVGGDGGPPRPATLRGLDGETDLALLAVDGLEAPVVERALDAAPRVGDAVFAAGREPSGLLHASFGHVGAAGGAWRAPRGGRIDRLIRLDGALPAGLDGAPVADADGQVLGIGSGAFARGNGVVLPVATVDRVLAALLAHGRVPRGYVGLVAQTVRLADGVRAELGVDATEGLLVVSLADDGPAAAAGLMVGDIVVAAGGQPVADVEALRERLGGDAVGARLRLRVARGGRPLELAVEVAERPRSRCR